MIVAEGGEKHEHVEGRGKRWRSEHLSVASEAINIIGHFCFLILLSMSRLGVITGGLSFVVSERERDVVFGIEM